MKNNSFQIISTIKNNFLAQALPISKFVISALQKVQKQFIWKDRPPKIKHETICNTCEKGGLKNIDNNSKTRSLQCLWIQKLYDDSFHEWKLTPLYLIKKSFEKTSFSTLISISKFLSFPLSQNIIGKW